MTGGEQRDWITEQAYRDPFWADTEATIRRQAVDIVRRLISSDCETRISVALWRPDAVQGGLRTVTVHRGDLVRVGGYEQVLLVEEIIRRALR